MLHQISLDGIPPQPWKNGGGSTQELLAWPTPEDWTLRISVARIDRDGPFSAFPGIDRWFAVLAGDGVILQFGDTSLTRTPGHEPLHFDGGLAPGCALLDGPTTDVNLMLRRDRMTGRMLRATGDEEWRTGAPFRALLTAAPVALHVDDATPLELPAGALAWDDEAGGQRWRLAPRNSAPHAWWIEVRPVGA